MAHGESVEGEITKLRVWLANELDREAKDSIKDAKYREVSSLFVRRKLARHNKQNCEEDQAFEDCFVKLRRVPRNVTRNASEIHSPRQIAGRAPQLAVNEVRTTAEEKPNRHANKRKIKQTQVFDFHNFSAEKTANEAANKTTMEAHAAFIDCKNFQRVLPIITVAVENNVAQPRPYDNSGNSAQDAGKDLISLNLNFSTPGNKHQNNTGAGKPQNVSDTVSPNCEAPDLKSHRVKTMK